MSAAPAPLAQFMLTAASLEISGQTESALAELSEARDAGHDSAKLHNAIGHLHFALRHFEPASQAYGDVSRLDPTDAPALYNKAVCLERLNLWEAAAAEFQKAVDLDSRRASALLGLGISQLHLDRPAQALEALDRCLERQPFRETALHARAIALQQLRRFEEASAAYQSLLSRDADSVQLLSNAISLALSDGDSELLARCSARLLELEPSSTIACEGSALAAFARRDFDGALQFCNALVARHPEHFAGWFNTGVALQKQGLFDQASEAYSRAAALDPSSPEAFLCLGTALQESARLEEARQAYDKALALDPNLRIALWNLALLYEGKGDFQTVAELCSRLVRHHPDAQDAWFRLGHARMQLSDYPAAVAAFDACRALPGNCPEAVLNTGIAYWKMGNSAAAAETLRPAVASESKSAEALRCLAAIALEERDYEQALTLHRQLLEFDEQNPDTLYNLALLLQKRGRTADAVRYYRQALVLRPGFQQALLNLGHALMISGKNAEAQAAWHEALQNDASLADLFLQ